MAQKYMTTVDVREAVRMYESGMSLTKISEVLGFSRRTITKHVHPQCAIRPSWEQNALQNGLLTEAEEREAAQLYRRGASKHELACRFNKYPQYFDAILRRHGVTIRRTLSKQNYAHYATPKTMAMTLLVATLYREEGMSVGEIAELVVRSWTAVHARLRRAGVVRNKQEAVKVFNAWSRKTSSEREARAHRARKMVENYRREYGA